MAKKRREYKNHQYQEWDYYLHYIPKNATFLNSFSPEKCPTIYLGEYFKAENNCIS